MGVGIAQSFLFFSSISDLTTVERCSYLFSSSCSPMTNKSTHRCISETSSSIDGLQFDPLSLHSFSDDDDDDETWLVQSSSSWWWWRVVLIPACCRRAKINSNFALVNSAVIRIRLVSKAGIDIYDSFCLVEVQKAAVVSCVHVSIGAMRSLFFSILPFISSPLPLRGRPNRTVRIHSFVVFVDFR